MHWGQTADDGVEGSLADKRGQTLGEFGYVTLDAEDLWPDNDEDLPYTWFVQGKNGRTLKREYQSNRHRLLSLIE